LLYSTFLTRLKGKSMFSTLRLTLATLFVALFVVACSDEATEEVATEAAPAAEASAAAPAAPAPTTDDLAGLTTEAAVAKWGEPALTQSYSIDSLTVDFYEWKTAEGIVAIQFQNGEAKYTQVLPAAE
jgi:hypothetical protein